MPQLTFPIVPDGLLVPVLVGLASPAMQALQARGAPLPKLVQARGMIDSGTTITAVAPSILAALNAAPGPATQTRTAAGAVTVRFFQISFAIYDLISGHALSRSDWTVTCLLQDLEDVDVLFGLDLLREINLNVAGPAGTFALVF